MEKAPQASINARDDAQGLFPSGFLGGPAAF
jgi:hypothetical protein